MRSVHVYVQLHGRNISEVLQRNGRGFHSYRGREQIHGCAGVIYTSGMRLCFSAGIRMHSAALQRNSGCFVLSFFNSISIGYFYKKID